MDETGIFSVDARRTRLERRRQRRRGEKRKRTRGRQREKERLLVFLLQILDVEREKYERAQKSSSWGVKTKHREKNTEHTHTQTTHTTVLNQYFCNYFWGYTTLLLPILYKHVIKLVVKPAWPFKQSTQEKRFAKWTEALCWHLYPRLLRSLLVSHPRARRSIFTTPSVAR